MHAILATFGTDGDVFPYLGLGRELAKRGHRVSLVTSGHYQSAALDGGMDFHELVSREEAEIVLANPDFWHPLKAGPLAAKWGVQHLRRQYQLLSGVANGKETVLVANPGVLAARLLHDKQKDAVPLVSIVLQPWLIPSVDRLPVMPGGLGLPRRSPRWMRRLYVRALNQIGDRLLGKELNALRSELGLAPIRQVFTWWLSPQLILGLFPEWFGTPQPDWPKQTRLISFPAYDGAEGGLPADIAKFIRDGERPVAVTFGTGVRHAHQLYSAALEACVRIGRRCVLVTKHPEQIRGPLPKDASSSQYAPFGKLLPLCAAIVHHGGIGTTARGLNSGVPQLIIPICFDQLDNAQRVKDLRCGSWLSRRAATPGRLASELQNVLRMKVNLPDGASRLNTANRDGAIERAADYVEEMTQRRHRHT